MYIYYGSIIPPPFHSGNSFPPRHLRVIPKELIPQLVHQDHRGGHAVAVAKVPRVPLEILDAAWPGERTWMGPPVRWRAKVPIKSG